jgi:predicted lipoprotein
MESDAAYFRRRAREERIAAAKTASSQASRDHQDLAVRYEELAVAIETQAREMGIESDGEPSGRANRQRRKRATMWL